LQPAKKLRHFLAIVTLFPHLVAGPIVRVRHILPQIEELKKPSPETAWNGLQLVAYGLFKKMALADNLAPVVNRVYSDPSASGLARLIATIAFAFQIYYDFSGYTDIARGMAKWVGVEFTLNFDRPYTSIGIRDFWSRWHISLSYWIRDYVYIPLGGSRYGEAKTHRNIWIAMLAAGLWHGANWTFLFWGGLHAVYQSVERITKWPAKFGGSAVGRLAGVLITFAIVTFGWVFFRAETIHDGFAIVASMLNPNGYHRLGINANIFFWPALVGAFGIELCGALQRHVPLAWREPVMARAALAGAMLAGAVFLKGPGQTFIYFQF
jgi:alginate O-acetyltransferase complex protein AlgI